MALKEIVARVLTLDELIKSQKTGTRVDIANHFGLTTRAIHNYINAFRAAGREVEYDEELESFVYPKKPGDQS